MACSKSREVNVGYPDSSQREMSIGEQDEESRTLKRLAGSQKRHTTGEASNDRGGKDAG